MPDSADLQTLIAKSTKVNSDYATMKSAFTTGSYTPPSQTTADIMTAININLAELDLINNMSIIKNNVNQELLVKKNKLLRMKNDDLMNQLRELEQIESAISNKNKLIEQTNSNILNQELNIKVLIASAILAVILLIAIILYGYSIININKLILVIIIITICYILIFMYSYNIFYYKDAITYLFDRREQRLGYALKNWSDVKQSNLKDALYGSESTWVKDNCACPATTEEEDIIYATNQNSYATVTETPGHFYYDGSAPQQLLVPTPDPAILNENIEWVDYSSNGNISYNMLTNKITNTDTNYYNKNSATDPAILLAKRLATANTFVDEKTYTSNL